jgi:hypothetical protein
MTRRPRGEAEVEELLRGGQLQQVTGAQTDGQPFLESLVRLCMDGESASLMWRIGERHRANRRLQR